MNFIIHFIWLTFIHFQETFNSFIIRTESSNSYNDGVQQCVQCQCTMYSASVQPSLIFSYNWIPIFISNSSKRTESLDANKSLAISYLELTLRNIDSFRVSIFFLISRKWNIVKKTEYLKKYLFRASSPLHPLAEMETSGVGETNQGHYHNISYLNILNISNWEKYFLCYRSTWSGLSSTSWPRSSSLWCPW